MGARSGGSAGQKLLLHRLRAQGLQRRRLGCRRGSMREPAAPPRAFTTLRSLCCTSPQCLPCGRSLATRWAWAPAHGTRQWCWRRTSRRRATLQVGLFDDVDTSSDWLSSKQQPGRRAAAATASQPPANCSFGMACEEVARFCTASPTAPAASFRWKCATSSETEESEPYRIENCLAQQASALLAWGHLESISQCKLRPGGLPPSQVSALWMWAPALVWRAWRRHGWADCKEGFLLQFPDSPPVCRQAGHRAGRRRRSGGPGGGAAGSACSADRPAATDQPAADERRAELAGGDARPQVRHPQSAGHGNFDCCPTFGWICNPAGHGGQQAF